MSNKTAHLLIILIVVGALSQQSSCHKSIDCVNNKYLFAIKNLTASPEADTIKINDTLWFSMDCPTKSLDQLSQSLIDYSQASNLGTAVAFGKYDSNAIHTPIPAANDFKIVLKKGNRVANRSPELTVEFNFLEESGKYSLVFGIIPQTKGRFLILFSDATNVYRKNDDCTKATYTITFQSNEHRYLNPNYNGEPDHLSVDYYILVK